MKQNDTKKFLAELTAKYPAAIEKELVLHRTLREAGVRGEFDLVVDPNGIRRLCRRNNVSLRWGIRLNDGPRAGYGRLFVSINSGFGADVECRSGFRLEALDERPSIDLSHAIGRGELDSLCQLCSGELLNQMDFLAVARQIATCFVK